MRYAIACGATALLLFSQLVYARVQPPNITFLNQHGARRGATTRLVVIGTNLNGADRVFFDDPAISGLIVSARDWSVVSSAQPANSDSGAGTTPPAATAPRDIARKVELHIDMHVAPEVALGTHAFRIRTPLGSTELQTIAIGDTKEVLEREPNDMAADAQVLEWPVTVNGRMQEPGDVDCYRVDLSAGQRVVFVINAASLGSRMDSVLDLRDEQGAVVGRNDDGAWNARDSRLEFEGGRAAGPGACHDWRVDRAA
jgi:hypothetical protein